MGMGGAGGRISKGIWTGREIASPRAWTRREIDLDLDELLDAINDEIESVLVDVAHVAGVVEALGVDALRGRVGTVEVALCGRGNAMEGTMWGM